MVDPAKIKARREQLELTMEEAAKRAEFLAPNGEPHRQRWYDVESGRRREISADTLYAVAKALRCTMESLMSGDDPKPAPQPRKRRTSHAKRSR